MAVRFYGIRHHGPGSAKALMQSMEAWQPDALVIEAPSDVQEAWPACALEGMQPPVALLVYNSDDLRQAAYYPFAVFSPEWNAALYALRQGIPIFNMDLPMSLRWGYARQEAERQAGVLLAEQPERDEIGRDPLGYLARLAGYADVERWWEATFEHIAHSEAVFEVILSMMRELRAAAPMPSGIEALREAYMRKTLRDAQKKGYERIAVVCGAWHLPALADLQRYKASDDQGLLKGIAKTKVQSTWIPWTYERLASSAGYGAGVEAPAWYQMLFETDRQAPLLWLAQAARLLRRADLYAAGSASIIEAVRLAEALAAMRLLPLPGIDELWEAAVAVLGQGDEERLAAVRRLWLVGQTVGDTPPDLPSVPLHADIERQAKSLRIPKPTQKTWLKATASKPQGGLDLRREHDRQQSRFLHRLRLLGIHWGEPGANTGREQGTMNEYWQLLWQPELVLDMVEAAVWGNTLETAAAGYALHQTAHCTELPELTALFEQCLCAELPEVMDLLGNRLQALAARTSDIAQLIDTLPPLVYARRYGDVRQTDAALLEYLLAQIVPRACLGLPAACSGWDEEQSQRWKMRIQSLCRSVAALQNAEYEGLRLHALEQIADMESAHALLRGYACRLLFDAHHQGAEELANRLHRVLSPAAPVAEAAAWIEGLLAGSGMLLLHHPVLRHLLDDWISALPQERFAAALPVLRRTFALFSVPERQKLLQWIQTGANPSGEDMDRLLPNPQLVALWLPTWQLCLA